MELLDGEALLDGGTTCLTIRKDEKKYYLTIDYSLPHDGRVRYLHLSNNPFSSMASERLEKGSKEEQEIIQWLIETLRSKFEVQRIVSYLRGEVDNFGEGKWFFTLNFLRLVAKERKVTF